MDPRVSVSSTLAGGVVVHHGDADSVVSEDVQSDSVALVAVVSEELAGVVASLADASTERVPRAGLPHQTHVGADVDELAVQVHALAVKNVELRLTEGRSELVLDHLDASTVPMDSPLTLMAPMRRMSSRTDA